VNGVSRFVPSRSTDSASNTKRGSAKSRIYTLKSLGSLVNSTKCMNGTSENGLCVRMLTMLPARNQLDSTAFQER
jgi:hypothetical protein